MILTAIGIISALVGWFRVIRPRWRTFWGKVNGSLDTLNGRGPITEPGTGRELAPAQPPLGNRMANVEGAVIELREVVKLLAAVQERQDEQGRQLGEHSHRLTSLEEGRLERIVTKAEAAQAWRAVADKDIEES